MKHDYIFLFKITEGIFKLRPVKNCNYIFWFRTYHTCSLKLSFFY